MRIQIAKRHDGSQMWQKHNGRHAAHFALHDLTHFAVESTLRYETASSGFSNKVGRWTISRAKVSAAEAIEVEELVGSFDVERACGGHWTIDDFNYFARMRIDNGFPARTLTGDEVALVNQCRGEVFSGWATTPTGESLEVQF